MLGRSSESDTGRKVVAVMEQPCAAAVDQGVPCTYDDGTTKTKRDDVPVVTQCDGVRQPHQQQRQHAGDGAAAGGGATADDGATAGGLGVPKLLYFMYCAANAVFVPYAIVFYKTAMGFGSAEVGALTAARPLMLMVFAPFWGFVSDRVWGPRTMLLVTMITITVVRTLFFGANYVDHPFGVLVTLNYVAEAFSCAIFPLMDVMVLGMLGRARRLDWGKVRLWGAIGWGLTAVLCGLLFDATTLQLMWLVYPLAMAITLVCVLRMPPPQAAPDDREDDDDDDDGNADANGDMDAGTDADADAEGRQGMAHMSRLAKLKVLMSQPTVVLFLAIEVCMGALMGVISNFLFVWLEDLGSPNWLVGASLTVTCVAEAPLLHYSGAIIKRFGVVPVLALALVCYAIRLQWYAHLTVPYWVLPAELLHGITYGVGWAAGTCYAAQIAPRGLEGTMQGLLSSAHWGVGAAAGAIGGGAMYDTIGPVATFHASGSIAVVGLLLCAVAWRCGNAAPYHHVPATDDRVTPDVANAADNRKGLSPAVSRSQQHQQLEQEQVHTGDVELAHLTT